MLMGRKKIRLKGSRRPEGEQGDFLIGLSDQIARADQRLETGEWELAKSSAGRMAQAR